MDESQMTAWKRTVTPHTTANVVDDGSQPSVTADSSWEFVNELSGYIIPGPYELPDFNWIGYFVSKAFTDTTGESVDFRILFDNENIPSFGWDLVHNHSGTGVSVVQTKSSLPQTAREELNAGNALQFTLQGQVSSSGVTGTATRWTSVWFGPGVVQD